jgi:hypothetical protein
MAFLSEREAILSDVAEGVARKRSDVQRLEAAPFQNKVVLKFSDAVLSLVQ